MSYQHGNYQEIFKSNQNTKLGLIFIMQDNCCLPKEEGGIGLQNLKSWNLALISKTLGNMKRKIVSLLIHWVHKQYLNSVNIWRLDPKNGDSLLIKKILLINDKLLVASNNSSTTTASLLNSWFLGKGTQEAYDWFRPKWESKYQHKFI